MTTVAQHIFKARLSGTRCTLTQIILPLPEQAPCYSLEPISVIKTAAKREKQLFLFMLFADFQAGTPAWLTAFPLPT